MKKKAEKKTSLFPFPPLKMPIMPPDGIVVDPMGSYTGRPVWEDDVPVEDMMPVQDADDL